MSEHRLLELSSQRMGLVRLMQGIWFGRIEDLHVVRGEPVSNPRPQVVKQYKFGDKKSLTKPNLKDFALKKEVLELFDLLDELGDGVVRRLQIQNGLPSLAEVEVSTVF